MNIKCGNCGYELHGEKFCPNCGTRVIYPSENNNNNITPQEMQRRVSNGKKQADNDQAFGGCLGTIGLLGGIWFLVSGHPIIATIFFVVFFGLSVYAVMPH